MSEETTLATVWGELSLKTKETLLTYCSHNDSRVHMGTLPFVPIKRIEEIARKAEGPSFQPTGCCCTGCTALLELKEAVGGKLFQ